MDTVALIGYGAMGSALYSRLRLSDPQVVVYDVAPAALEAARSDGAATAETPAAAARNASIVDVIVRTDEDVLACTLGPNGILEAARLGTLLLLHSSIHPRTTQQVAEAAHALGVEVMDACAMGVPNVVRSGDLMWLLGGNPGLQERATPHLLRMGKKVIYMGPLGAANVAKLVHNLVGGSERLVIYEALQIAQAAGIPYPQTLEMMRTIPHHSLISRWEHSFDPSGQTMMPHAGSNTLSKDMPLALEVGRDYGLDLPISEELVKAALRVVEADRSGES
jgi:3-hydroxyisobutyrate dehydrogenase